MTADQMKAELKAAETLAMKGEARVHDELYSALCELIEESSPLVGFCRLGASGYGDSQKMINRLEALRDRGDVLVPILQRARRATWAKEIERTLPRGESGPAKDKEKPDASR